MALSTDGAPNEGTDLYGDRYKAHTLQCLSAMPLHCTPARQAAQVTTSSYLWLSRIRVELGEVLVPETASRKYVYHTDEHVVALLSRVNHEEEVYMAFKILSLGHLGKRRTLADEPSLIPVCSSCGLIRDETGVSCEQARWVTKRTYVETHGRSLADSLLTHTYCPGCFTDFKERVRPSTSSIGKAQ